MLARLCPRCGVTLPASTIRGPCDDCRRKGERDKSKRRRQRQRDVRDSRAWQLARTAALNRDRHSCRRCGSTTSLGVHHIQPLAAGGNALSLENLITLCRLCHEQEEKGPVFEHELSQPLPKVSRHTHSTREKVAVFESAVSQPTSSDPRGKMLRSPKTSENFPAIG